MTPIRSSEKRSVIFPQPMGNMALFRRHPMKLATCAGAAPVMIWSAGAVHRRDYFNSQWLDYRGRMLQEEIGNGWTEGVHPDDLKHCLEACALSFDQRRSFQVDYRLRRNDGAYRWVMDSAAPRFLRSGLFVGYVGACVDIHDRKVAEQALEVSVAELRRHKEELMDFAYGASHDLREPLRTIASYTQLLATRCECDDDTVEFVGFISEAVDRMQNLIGALLNYSSVSSGANARLVDLDCNAIVQEAVIACEAAAQEAEAEISHDSLPTIRADRAQLGQVFQNLIGNAIKYRKPQERPRIHISSAEMSEEWVFEVADNGIGFEAQYADRIFGLFKRLHGLEYRGSGLGLGICKRIIERHGGRIWATSRPGDGSQFFFTLPKI